MSNNTPVRDWLEVHPRTSLYIAVVVTILLVLNLIELLRIG